MLQIKEFFEYIFDVFKIWVIIQPWQQGIRVRNGNKTKLLEKGIYFKIPYFDSVYIQESRLRIGDTPTQTVTTKDSKTITISSAIGYSIVDIQKLYDTLYHPETTISNIASSEVASFIFTKNSNEINPSDIEGTVLNKLNSLDYGLKFEYFKITSFAIARTFRLIQDQQWGVESLNMDKKK